MKILIIILLLGPCAVLAENSTASDTVYSIATPVENKDKELKISGCIKDYIKKQSRSYAKIAQENLYNLIHNFDDVLVKIYGKKPSYDDITHQEKIELLAKIQCEAYYKMGILK